MFDITLFDVSVHLLFLLSVILALALSRQGHLMLKARKSGYGTVFDSVTGKPISLVAIRLRDLHGATVRSVVSDALGRYRLSAAKGEYLVELTKEGYSFPSQQIKEKGFTSFYDNVLPAAHIIIKDHGAITKNIPMDPTERKVSISFLNERLVLRKRTQALIGLSSPIIAVIVMFFLWRSIPAWFVFIFYMLTLADRIFSFKLPDAPFGVVRDEETKLPVDKAIVRVFSRQFNKMIETQITSVQGRYAFIVNKGTYHVIVKKDGYKAVRLNFPEVKKDGYLLAKDVALKREMPE